MRRKLKHVIEYAGLLILARSVRLLPLSAARALGKALGWFVCRVLGLRIKVTLDNLAQAFPERTDADLQELALRNYQHFGMMLIEYLRLPYLGDDELFDLLDVDGTELLHEAMQQGSGGILVLCHFGNWEYLGAWLAQKGFPTTFVYQGQSNPYVSRHILAARERARMKMVKRGMAMRAYLRALKAGEFIGLLADQDGGRNGVFVDFMGRPASTPTGPAVFAQRYNVPMFFAITWRDAAHNLHGRVEKVALDLSGATPEEAIASAVQSYTSHLEKWVRRYPHLWFWMHRRWKSVPETRTTGTTAT